MPLSGADAPVKKSLVVVNRPGALASNPASAIVVKSILSGPVTFFDRVKAYYHTLITVVGGVLALLNQVSSAVGWIPDYGPKLAGYVSVGIIFVTALLNFLKSNEVIVDDL